MKRSVILTDRLGPDILSAFWTKGQVLHRERAHLKLPGFSIVLNVQLTTKLPTFLSRLNEISGGCVGCTSYRIILQYFKVVEDDGFYWVIVRVNGFLSFFFVL